jgi:hypothetical protein
MGMERPAARPEAGDRIEQCARMLMARFGEDARTEALLRADAARMYHDRLGVDVWQRVATAIGRLKPA